MPDISDNQLADRLQLVGSWLLKQRGQGALHPGTIMDAPLLAEVFRGAIFWDEGANGIADALYVVRKNDADELEFTQVVVDAEPVLDTPTVTDFTNMPHAHTSAATGGLLPNMVRVFNVKDYGAVGDGVTDDTDAYVAARAAAVAAAGGVIHFPTGTYLVTEALDLPSRIHIRGDGMYATVLKSAGAFNLIESIERQRNSVSHLTIDMTDATGGQAIAFNGTDGFQIHHVNIVTSGISIGGGSSDQHEGSISYCYIQNPSVDGISLANDCRRLNVSNNIIYFDGDAGEPEAGINVSSSHHCTIANNIIWSNVLTTSGHGGVRLTNSAEHNSITGNTIHNWSRGIFVASTALEGNTLVGNTVDGALTHGALIETNHTTLVGNSFYNVYENGTGGAAVVLSGAQNCLVAANNIFDDRGTKLHTYGVAEINGADNNIIGLNKIVGFLTARYLIAGTDSSLVAADSSTTARGFGIQPTIVGIRTNGTEATQTGVVADDGLLFIGVRGHNGTNVSSTSRGSVSLHAAENWTTSATGTYVDVAVTSNGTTSRTSRLRVEHSGMVTFRNGSTVNFAIEADGDIRTSRSAAATVLGSVTRRLQIFDASGNSLGYIPIYDAIT